MNVQIENSKKSERVHWLFTINWWCLSKLWKTIIQQKKGVLIVFDDMIADIESNRTLNPKVTELFLRGRKLNISFVFILQPYFKVVPKTIRLMQHIILSLKFKRTSTIEENFSK